MRLLQESTYNVSTVLHSLLDHEDVLRGMHRNLRELATKLPLLPLEYLRATAMGALRPHDLALASAFIAYGLELLHEARLLDHLHLHSGARAAPAGAHIVRILGTSAAALLTMSLLLVEELGVTRETLCQHHGSLTRIVRPLYKSSRVTSKGITVSADFWTPVSRLAKGKWRRQWRRQYLVAAGRSQS